MAKMRNVFYSGGAKKKEPLVPTMGNLSGLQVGRGLAAGRRGTAQQAAAGEAARVAGRMEYATTVALQEREIEAQKEMQAEELGFKREALEEEGLWREKELGFEEKELAEDVRLKELGLTQEERLTERGFEEAEERQTAEIAAEERMQERGIEGAKELVGIESEYRMKELEEEHKFQSSQLADQIGASLNELKLQLASTEKIAKADRQLAREQIQNAYNIAQMQVESGERIAKWELRSREEIAELDRELERYLGTENLRIMEEELGLSREELSFAKESFYAQFELEKERFALEKEVFELEKPIYELAGEEAKMELSELERSKEADEMREKGYSKGYYPGEGFWWYDPDTGMKVKEA